MQLKKVILLSEIKCPSCEATATEKMPENACTFFYKCKACSTVLRPNPGDCCVFCSFGSVKCPPIQLQVRCCS